MKKNNNLKKIVIIFLALMLAGTTKAFAEKRPLALSIVTDNPEKPYSNNEEYVTSVADIEMPLRQKDYGKYYDDFNRLVANEIRLDAKKLYLEQEKAKEISSLEDAVMPLIKKDGISGRFYETNSSLNKYPVAFYDSLGRKISDDLIEEAAKLYDKQQRRRELSYWGATSVSEIWYYIWSVVKFIIILMIIFFAAKVFYKKVIKKE